MLLPSMQQHHHIYIDYLNHLWIYTAHSVSNRPKCYYINEHRWIESPLTKFMDKFIISSLISDDDGNMWFATENQGVYVCSLNAENEQTLKVNRLMCSHLLEVISIVSTKMITIRCGLAQENWV